MKGVLYSECKLNGSIFTSVNWKCTYNKGNVIKFLLETSINRIVSETTLSFIDYTLQYSLTIKL